MTFYHIYIFFFFFYTVLTFQAITPVVCVNQTVNTFIIASVDL